jgi:hypothetical protein
VNLWIHMNILTPAISPIVYINENWLTQWELSICLLCCLLRNLFFFSLFKLPFFVVVVFQPRALSKYSATELHPQPLCLLFLFFSLIFFPYVFKSFFHLLLLFWVVRCLILFLILLHDVLFLYMFRFCLLTS